MAFAYGLTTPIGQAIGLALLFSPGTSYDPASRSALILVGTMNALSAGLLLWASLVELLAAGTTSARLSIDAQARLIIVLPYRLLRRRKNDRHHGSRPCVEARGVRMRTSRRCGDGNCRSMGLTPYRSAHFHPPFARKKPPHKPLELEFVLVRVVESYLRRILFADISQLNSRSPQMPKETFMVHLFGSTQTHSPR